MSYGSLMNYLQANAAQREPQVGDGATLLMWTDRQAYTIVEVMTVKSGPNKGQVNGVVAKRDIAKRTDSNGMSDSQTYEFTTNPEAQPEIFTLRKDGSFVAKGTAHSKLAIGYRSQYHDFSF